MITSALAWLAKRAARKAKLGRMFPVWVFLYGLAHLFGPIRGAKLFLKLTQENSHGRKG